MAVIEIKKFNEPVLRQKCEEVKKITPEIKELVFDMSKIMIENQGIGLAAPQVGISKRIIMVQLDPRKLKFISLINPKIFKKSHKTEIGKEGCLSFPDIFLEIKRAKEIEIEGLNIKGKKVKMKAKGLAARVFQHEVDHLDGVLFFNRLGFFQKIKFKLRYLSIKL